MDLGEKPAEVAPSDKIKMRQLMRKVLVETL